MGKSATRLRSPGKTARKSKPLCVFAARARNYCSPGTVLGPCHACAVSCCCIPVTDYDELRQSAAVIFVEKVAEVRTTVAKPEKAQQKGEAALELFVHRCNDQFA